eukprot:339534_1
MAVVALRMTFLLKNKEIVTIEPTAFIWIIQIYLVILCWAMRDHYRYRYVIYMQVMDLLMMDLFVLSEMTLAAAFLLISIGFVLLGGYRNVFNTRVKDGIPSLATHCVTVLICSVCIAHKDANHINTSKDHMNSGTTAKHWVYFCTLWFMYIEE